MKFLKQSLVAASVITISATLFSKLLGYVREAVIAGFFGTESIFDTFIIAITVPELISSIAFIVLPTAILPALRKGNNSNDSDDSGAFWTGLLIFLIFFALLSSLIYFSRSTILNAFSSGLKSDRFPEAVRLMSILSWLVFFRGMESYFRSWLFKAKQFLLPALSNIVINAVILIVLIGLYDRYKINALAYGWLLGASSICIISAIFTFIIIKPHFKFRIDVGIGLLKAVLLVGIVQSIPLFYPAIDRYFAAKYLGEGQIAALRYAMILILIPATVFVMSYNIASFPWITEYSDSNNSRNLSKLYRESIRLLIYTMGFISAGLIIFSKEIVIVAFQRGAFGNQSLILTSGPFMYYALGLLFYSIYTFQIKFYFARRLFARIGVIFLILLFVKTIASRSLVMPLEQNGLAVATVLAWSVGFIVMTIDLGRQLKIKIGISSLIFIAKIIIILSVTIYGWVYMRDILLGSTDYGILRLFIRLSVISLAGILVYLGLSYIFRVEEANKIYGTVKRIFVSRRGEKY